MKRPSLDSYQAPGFRLWRHWLIALALLACNSLVHASSLSPYLARHAQDTITWQPFSSASFASAREHNKPLLISIGYLSCYWCHRLQTESFTNQQLGDYVNQHFVPILVDRELEPELDAYLQRVMTQIRGVGGWPLTVILTPQAQPVSGFSYATSEQILNQLKTFTAQWNSTPETIIEYARRWAPKPGKPPAPDSYIQPQALLEKLLEQAQAAADNEYGGFGDGAKFPFTAQLRLLLELDRRQADSHLRPFLQTTLSAMIGGALHDHLGSGFFRYSDDREWSRPHYEKMAYTQALLAPLLMDAGTQWQQPVYRRIATETLLQLIDDFRMDNGLYRSALSAVGESGEEGGYYLWRQSELSSLLETDADTIYNLLGDDELILPFIIAQQETAKSIRSILIKHRKTRMRLTDDKALTGINALILAALARGATLDNRVSLAATELAALLCNHKALDNPRQLVADERTPEASFTAGSYLLYGCSTWALESSDTELMQRLNTALKQHFKRHYSENQWQLTDNKPLIGNTRESAIRDTQLPSASALWLESAIRLKQNNDDAELAAMIEQVRQSISADLLDDAFFHASLVYALVTEPIRREP